MTPAVAPGATPGGRAATPLGRAEQDAAMALARAAGTPWAVIARDHNLSRSQVHRRVKAHLAATATAARPGPQPSPGPPPSPAQLLTIDGLQVVADLERALTAAFERFDHIAATSAHEGIQVSAIRRGLDARFEHLGLLQQIGVVRPRLRAYTDNHRVARVVQAISEVLRSHEIPDHVIRQLTELAQAAEAADQDYISHPAVAAEPAADSPPTHPGASVDRSPTT